MSDLQEMDWRVSVAIFGLDELKHGWVVVSSTPDIRGDWLIRLAKSVPYGENVDFEFGEDFRYSDYDALTDFTKEVMIRQSELPTKKPESLKAKEFSRRLGKFTVSNRQIIEEHEKVLALMSKMIVVRAESRWDKDAIDYIAVSDMFEVVYEGVEPPEYSIKITMVGNDLEVSAVKV